MAERSGEGPQGDGAGPELTHIDPGGRARMVDVTGKPWTRRRATARCRVDLGPRVAQAVGEVGGGEPASGGVGWAEVLGTARLAGIQAAKQTSTLIPLCHPLTVSNVDVHLTLVGDSVHVEGRAEVVGPTGVEMEALAACAVASLSVAATVLPIAPEVSITEVGLWKKTGGRSGTWLRPAKR